MKNLFKVSLLVIFMTTAQMFQSNAFAGNLKTPKTAELSSAEAQKLINRLEEIKAMDKDHLTKSEKRSLRDEVRKTNATLRSNGGIYLSVGAVIIIILLLILLL